MSMDLILKTASAVGGPADQPLSPLDQLFQTQGPGTLGTSLVVSATWTPSTNHWTRPWVQSMRYSCSVVVGLEGGATEKTVFWPSPSFSWLVSQRWLTPLSEVLLGSESHSMSVSWELDLKKKMPIIGY